MTQTINNPAESIRDSRPRHRFIGSSKNPLFDCLAARFIRSRNRESGRAQNSTLGHRSILVVLPGGRVIKTTPSSDEGTKQKSSVS